MFGMGKRKSNKKATVTTTENVDETVDTKNQSKATMQKRYQKGESIQVIADENGKTAAEVQEIVVSETESDEE